MKLPPTANPHLGGHVLDLLVRHLEFKLLNTRLDGVPAREARTDVFLRRIPPVSHTDSDSEKQVHDPSLTDVSGHAKVFGLEDLVSGRVGEDSLGVDTGPVGGAKGGKKSTPATM